MSEDAELKARIAAIQGRLDEARQHPKAMQSPHQPFRNHAHHHWRGRGHRYPPYGRGGRGGRGGFMPVPNRTLVLNGAQPAQIPISDPATPNNEPTNAPNAPQDAFISARRPGMNQLINREAYDRQQKQNQEHTERTRTAKRQQVDREETSKLNQYTSAQANREIIVEGIRFQLREDGSKLIRISDQNDAKQVPRKVTIADVNFFRTKNGNFVRANALKTTTRYHLTEVPYNVARSSRQLYDRPQKKNAQCEDFSKHGTHTPNRRLDRDHPWTTAHHFLPAGKPCSSLTHATGTCPRGPMCSYAHDPSKVAVCPKFLKSACAKGDDCDLSHEPTYSNTPACTHFLRGNCTNDACRYPHVHVSPTAPVCVPFARCGFCDNQNCDKRHIFECPDYANTGYCAKAASGRCQLPHPDHAAAMRKAAAKQARMDTDDSSDLSSEEENEENDADVEDVDSDDVEDLTDVQNHDHGLTQQQDYVAFS